MTVKVPGFKGSKGMTGFLIPAGRYLFEINSVTLEEKKNDKGSGTSWNFKLGIKDGPEENKSPAYTHRVYIMNDDHESFEQHGHIGVDELKSMAMAAGVIDDIKGESIDPEVFVGAKLVGVVSVGKRKDTQEEQNNVRKWEAVE